MALALALAALPAGAATLPGWDRGAGELLALLFDLDPPKSATRPAARARLLPWLAAAPVIRPGRIDLAVLEGPAGGAGRFVILPARVPVLRAPAARPTIPTARPPAPATAPATAPGLVTEAEIAAWRAGRKPGAAVGAPGPTRITEVVLPDASPVPLPPGAALLPAALGLLGLLRRRSQRRDNRAAAA